MMRYEYAMVMEAANGTPLVEKRVLSRRRRITKESRGRANAKLRLIGLIVLSVMMIGLAGNLLFGPEVSAADEVNIITVTIGSGDSLWSIADEYGSDEADVRDTIKEITELNELNVQDSLFPGMTLKVPVISEN
ncbi:MAG: LysM peptidoglycan-binding domain-containing protein [Clostridiales Family XIII bacterium]|nr:LysM peptidoglycan-binding domain-containing protein [Clostridiales Family XIII bacterium]